MELGFPHIETARLRLRIPHIKDTAALHSLWHDPEVTKYIPIILYNTEEEIRDFLTRVKQRWGERGFGMLTVTAKENDEMIGYCGLQYLNDGTEVEVYYGFSRDSWDQGFATEAAKAVLRFGFEEVGLEAIAGVTQPGNTASQKVLEKIGLKKHSENRKFYDTECAYFNILRNDYSPDDSFYRLTRAEIEGQSE